MGNLGYDTPKTQVEERARAILAQTSFPPPSDLQAVYAYGSTVRMSWSQGADVYSNRREVRDLKAVQPEMTAAAQQSRGEVGDGHKYVWLDVKKTKAEMVPSRLVRKAGELIQAETEKMAEGTRPVVVVCPIGKKVWIGGKPRKRKFSLSASASHFCS